MIIDGILKVCIMTIYFMVKFESVWGQVPNDTLFCIVYNYSVTGNDVIDRNNKIRNTCIISQKNSKKLYPYYPYSV